ncbi:hypothetical protein V8J82_23145 [Gymnodinialimonas sp. 2305UL16-5]|uniref:hypothetical protein n=1 Tax=Gymnodinialimonas mytili TaxID=3126503 RepID=UPI0030B6DB6D
MSQFILFPIYFLTVCLATWMFANVITTTLSRCLASCPIDGKERVFFVAVVLGLLLLSGSGIIIQFNHDWGRFDVFNFILCLLAYQAIMRWSAVSGLLCAIALSSASIVVHEAAFFWLAPFTIGFWLWTHRPTPVRVGTALAACALLAGITWAVSSATYSDYVDYDTAAAAVRDRADFPIREDSLAVQFRSFEENFAYTAERVLVDLLPVGLALGLIYLLVYVSFVRSLAAPEDRFWSLGMVIWLLACFAPLALLVLGHDHGRWIGMINCNLALVMLAQLTRRPERLARLPWGVIYSFLLMVVIQVALGPMGKTRLFPDAAFWELVAQIAG